MIQASIIIPTRNRANYLEKVLSSLVNQTIDNSFFEIIIIDNGSTDNTIDIVNKFRLIFTNYKYVFEELPGLHVGRNIGYQIASSEILIYADDDIEATPTWVESIIESFTNKEVMLVGGNNNPKFESDPPYWIQKMWRTKISGINNVSLLSIINLGNDPHYIDPYNIYGCNFAVRKNILNKCQGFHPDGMPPELVRFRGDGESYISSYIRDFGYKTYFNPKASVYHFVPISRMTLKYFRRRSYTQGISNSFASLRKGDLSEKQILKGVILKNIRVLLLSQISYFYKTLSYLQIIDLAESDKYLINEIRVSHLAGYVFHQKEVLKDSDLLKWIKMENYLDNSRYKEMLVNYKHKKNDGKNK